RITGKNNLDKYIAHKTQLLINQRVLETVSIDYSLGASEGDGALPVTLLIHVVDTWNLIILPYPKYDSNDGLTLSLKLRDFNFLGTMSPLKVDLGYQRDKDSNNIINFSIDSNTPFQAFGLDWNFNFDHYFAYTFGQPLYYQNVTGLSLNLPWQTTTFTVGFNQYITFNEKNSDDIIDLYGLDDYFYGPYASTELFTNWKIPFGIEIGDYGDLTYNMGVSGKVNYPYGKMDESRRPVTSFSQSIGFGNVDWIGNFQKGFVVSASNSYNWYFNRSDAPIQVTFNGTVAYYHPFSKYIAFYYRAMLQRWWQYSTSTSTWIPYYYAGDVIRGVVDEDLRADYMFSVNFDLPIRILRFWPSEWFNNPKLHFFDFEMHFSPFTDVALVQGPYNALKKNPYDGSKFLSLSDMVNTGGFEVIVYPGFFRSLKIRGSVGYNLQKIKNDGLPPLKFHFFPQWDEIYIGVDLYY
ncbi:MAG: hypothetical protein FWF26_04175, partial [Treponema sp.]|nr:hypothetical protein [Treponema sp.]